MISRMNLEALVSRKAHDFGEKRHETLDFS